ncbi:MAG: TRAP transporter permease, partial [Pseudomonadota bacterium]
MRLGGVIYVAPFFFVLNPALVGEAPAWEVMLSLSAALIGIWFLSCGLQGHFSLVGPIPEGAAGAILRLLLVVGGLCMAAPGGDWIGLSHGMLIAVGFAFAAPAILIALTRRRGEARA